MVSKHVGVGVNSALLPVGSCRIGAISKSQARISFLTGDDGVDEARHRTKSSFLAAKQERGPTLNSALPLRVDAANGSHQCRAVSLSGYTSDSLGAGEDLPFDLVETIWERGVCQ